MRLPHAATLPAIASVALLAAGCGSSSHNSGGGTAAHGGVAAAAYRFAACMRSHGVPNFPDPQVSSGPPGTDSVKVAMMASGNPRSPAIRAANKECAGILPAPQSTAQTAAQQHAREVDLLSFTECLRAHGLPDFPDPTSQGQLTIQMIDAAGVDLHAPQTLTAAKECIGSSHGAITPADVERAVNGPQ